MTEKTKDSISNQLQKKLGLTYEEYIKLDFEEQQKIISEYHKKNKCKKNDKVLVMIGSGEHSMFMKVRKGERIMIGSGEHSCFIKSGISLEESRNDLNDRIDDVLYSKPVALVKKIKRRLNK